jgi:hypothetical protein
MEVRTRDGIVFELPDGADPNGAEAKQIVDAKRAEKQQAQQAKEQQRIEDRTWGQAGKEALVNIPQSAVGLVKNVGSAILNPLDTLEGVADVVTGYGLNNNILGLGDKFKANTQKSIEQIDKRIAQAQEKGNLKRVKELQATRAEFEGLFKSYTDKSDGMTKMFKDRYGSWDATKNTLATDPAGLLLDASGVGGAGRAGLSMAGKVNKLGQVGKLANTAGKFADTVNPISAVGKGTKAVGNMAASVLDTATARVGSSAFKGALTAGADSAQAFLTRKQNPSKGFVEQMRGKGGYDDASIVELAKTKLLEAQKAKNNKYAKEMGDISGTRVSGAFDELNTIIKKAKDDYARTSGIVTDPAMMKFITDMEKRVTYFKKRPQLHTIEGMDKLKQNLQGMVETLPNEARAMRTAGSGISRGVSTAIGNANPKYKQTMSDYANSANMINNDFGRTLSLTNKATIDTTLRKLTSVTRNNVNTNFGQRLKSVQSLDEFGEVGALIPQIIGNTFKGYAPRSIGLPTAGVGAAGAVATGVASTGTAAAFLLAQSPRVIGEILYKIGQTGGVPARMLDVLATNPMFTQVIAPYLNLQQQGLEQG